MAKISTENPKGISKMTRPEISWSISHPTPLNPEYVGKLCNHAKRYTVDSFEICGQCHTPYGGLDGLINYKEYPNAAASWDQAQVAENISRMNEIVRIAHEAGKKVYYFHREVMLPPGLVKDIPDLIDSDGEFALFGETFANLIEYKIARAFAAVPELDGIVLTLTEADFSAIHNSNKQKYPPVEVVSYIIDCFAAALEKRGKRFIMRSFGSIAEDYENILAGAELSAKHHAFEIETKITPYDFDPFLPQNPYLRHIPGLTLSAECDSVGEFMGQGNLPFEHVEHIVRYVRQAQNFGVDRFTIRLDRRGNCIFDLYEINYYAYARAMEDPDVTAEQIRNEWAEKHYPASCRNALRELDRIGREMVTKIFFIDHQVMFHGNYALKYLKAGFIFALFHKGQSLENGRDTWSILTDRPSPGSAAVIQEKEEACRLAEQGLALYESLHIEDYRHRLWHNAVTVSRATLALVRCIAAYFEDMEHGNADAAALHAAVEAGKKELNHLAGHELSFKPREVFNGLEHRVNEVNSTMVEICLAPFAAILAALPEEYAGEWKIRQTFLKGSVDGIAAGGIYDDIRIHRYMHGSHAMLDCGMPARWAGNQVFPNGFFEFTLKRGNKLVIHGNPENAENFALVCDGVRRICHFDAQGIFRMPLASGSSTITLRGEKSGKNYPLFYSFATFQ